MYKIFVLLFHAQKSFHIFIVFLFKFIIFEAYQQSVHIRIKITLFILLKLYGNIIVTHYVFIEKLSLIFSESKIVKEIHTSVVFVDHVFFTRFDKHFSHCEILVTMKQLLNFTGIHYVDI
jgi:hypothetical protein